MSDIATKLRKVLNAGKDTYGSQLAGVLTEFGYKSVADVPDDKIFEVLEATRGACGMPTAFMLAKTRAAADGISITEVRADGDYRNNAQKIQDMALDYYAGIDANGLTLLDVIPPEATTAEALNAMAIAHNALVKKGLA